jgi:tetratricopeptide (TPR) repeat protein
MTTRSPCRLWTVGTWREVRQIGGTGQCFSSDGRLLAVQDASAIVRLVETETGRTLARLESPDAGSTQGTTFAPDASRLVIATRDGSAVHVWDLRAIRRGLAGMGLDWDAPPLPGAEDSTGDAGDQAPLEVGVDFGPLKKHDELYQSHLELYSAPADELIARFTSRLKTDPDDRELLHQRGHLLLRLERHQEALADFSAAAALRPLDAHLRAYKGVCLFTLKRLASALDELEAAFQTDPETVRAIVDLGWALNNRAWDLATGAELERDPVLACRLAALAVALAPGEQERLNTLGVALYRAGNFAQAIETLGRSAQAGKGQFDGFDLYFLAMAHHRLGQEARARACFDRANRWLRKQKSLNERRSRELAAFCAEAELVLAGTGGELPADVFAGPR